MSCFCQSIFFLFSPTYIYSHPRTSVHLYICSHPRTFEHLSISSQPRTFILTLVHLYTCTLVLTHVHLFPSLTPAPPWWGRTFYSNRDRAPQSCPFISTTTALSINISYVLPHVHLFPPSYIHTPVHLFPHFYICTS
jgi:hypothetical protein